MEKTKVTIDYNRLTELGMFLHDNAAYDKCTMDVFVARVLYTLKMNVWCSLRQEYPNVTTDDASDLIYHILDLMRNDGFDFCLPNIPKELIDEATGLLKLKED